MRPKHIEELGLPSLFIRLKFIQELYVLLKNQYHTIFFGLMMDSKHLNHIDLQSKHHLINPKTFCDAQFIGSDLLEVVMLIWQCH
jgi:hypothetical protein